MAGLLDFIKTPRSDNPNRKASLANRSQVYNLLDNIIGFEDDRVTPGEALGAGLRNDPIGLLSGAVRGVQGDLNNLMFEGGAMQRPQDVLGYAAAPMAPGAMSGRMANVMSSGGAKPKSITAYHGGTGDVANAAGGRGAWFSENKDLADEYAFGGGSVNQFSISPQRPIEFLHAEQRRPIGDLISTAVENAGDLSDETISAARGKISALQKRYGEEKRPLFEYWNKDPDIADLFRTLGYDSISVAEKSGGPQTWAALTPDIISPTPKAAPPGLLSIPEQTAKPKTSAAELRRQANIQRFGYDPNAVPEAPAPQDISEGFQAYLNQVNPDARRIPPENRPNLMMGDMYGMLPKGAKLVKSSDDVSYYRGPEGDYFATAYNPDVGEMDVVGYSMGGGRETDLQVVGEMQGKGIGGELQYMFRKENPNAPTGGLTEAGEKSLQKTYKRLSDEGVLSMIPATHPLSRLKP